MLDLRAPKTMGVLNRTSDSFADGDRYPRLDDALRRVEVMLAEGADLIDVGGESTRPGARPVSEVEELDRVVGTVEEIVRRFGCVVSVDTMKPAVMRSACAAGAELINDVNALRASGALEAAREAGAGVCLMHMQGEPRTMQKNPVYDDVTREVRDFLGTRVRDCVAAGIGREHLCVDPGFGFGKRLPHNLQLLAELPELTKSGLPVVVGFSRKSMLGAVVARSGEERVAAGLAVAVLAVAHGARIVRTHDVRQTVDALKMVEAVMEMRKQAE